MIGFPEQKSMQQPDYLNKIDNVNAYNSKTFGSIGFPEQKRFNHWMFNFQLGDYSGNTGNPISPLLSSPSF